MASIFASAKVEKTQNVTEINLQRIALKNHVGLTSVVTWIFSGIFQKAATKPINQ